MSWTDRRLCATVGFRPDGLPMLERGGELLERAVADCRDLLAQYPGRPARQQLQPALR